jgi:hypothetical protein
LFAEHFAGSYRFQRAIQKLRAFSFRHPGLANRAMAVLLRLAHLSEKWRWRGPYWYATGALRELAYWGGVAEVFNKEEDYLSYLQEGPNPIQTLDDAPVVDLALTPIDGELDGLLREASATGLLVTFDGLEVMAIPPEFGAEDLSTRHLRQGLQELSMSMFLGSPALQRYLFAAEEQRSR